MKNNKNKILEMYFVKKIIPSKIAEKLDAPVKSIDNAIQRIRKKAIKSITDEA